MAVARVAQRVGIQLPRARWLVPLKNRTISRAKRSAAMPGWAVRTVDVSALQYQDGLSGLPRMMQYVLLVWFMGAKPLDELVKQAYGGYMRR